MLVEYSSISMAVEIYYKATKSCPKTFGFPMIGLFLSESKIYRNVMDPSTSPAKGRHLTALMRSLRQAYAYADEQGL